MTTPQAAASADDITAALERLALTPVAAVVESMGRLALHR
jgi:hypothetical protein